MLNTQQQTIQLSSTETDVGKGIVFDEVSGLLYATGYTAGGLEGNSNQGVSDDAWWAAYNLDGELQTLTQFGTQLRDRAHDIITNSQGDIFLTGETSGDIDPNFDSDNQGSSDPWIARYTPDGERVWIDQFGSSGRDFSNSITLDSQGNLYITGHTEGSIAGSPNQGFTDIFVAKYDPNGEQEWVRQFGSSDREESFGIASDSNDNIYLTGTTYGSLEGQNAGENDIWLASFDADGNQRWIEQFGGNSTDHAYDITVDNEDSIYLTGFTRSVLEGGNSLSSDSWVARFNSSGNQNWIRQFNVGNVTDNVSAFGITTDDDNNVFLTGDTFRFSEDQRDAWVTQFDSEGNREDPITPPFGSADEDDVSNDITIGGNNEIYTIGQRGDDVAITESGRDDDEDDEDDDDDDDNGIPGGNRRQFILINDDEIPSSGQPNATVNLPVADNPPLTQTIFQDSLFNFDAFYDADSSELAGLGLRLHYDSSKINFNEFDDDSLLREGLLQQSSTPQDDTEDFDDDPETDRFINVVWTASVGQDDWPGETPVQLYRADFTTAPDLFTESEEEEVTTEINFTASSQPAGFELISQSAIINFDQYTYDIDGDGEINALTDGRLILRHLFGLDGEELIAGDVIGNGAIRNTAADIELFLEQGRQAFDLDGNGTAKPLTDGILLNRLMAGFTGEDLIENAIAPDATRTTAEEILNFINERGYFADFEPSPEPEPEPEPEPPLIEETTLSTNEDRETGDEIGSFNVFNLQGQPVSLSIVNGNEDNDNDDIEAFRLDFDQLTGQGRIIVLDEDEIDADLEEEFQLRIEATNANSGELLDTGTITILVNEVQQETNPFFPPPIDSTANTEELASLSEPSSVSTRSVGFDNLDASENVLFNSSSENDLTDDLTVI
ncbi:MAG: SBBP repeat-containing protein [Halothece sp.]